MRSEYEFSPLKAFNEGQLPSGQEITENSSLESAIKNLIKMNVISISLQALNAYMNSNNFLEDRLLKKSNKLTFSDRARKEYAENVMKVDNNSVTDEEILEHVLANETKAYAEPFPMLSPNNRGSEKSNIIGLVQGKK